VDPVPALTELIADRRRGRPLGTIAARFHNGLAAMVVQACCDLRAATGLNTVALSGGVWQNMFLLVRAVAGLRAERFEVLTHRQVPANDGGLALGQAAVAAERWSGNRQRS
jgi:hydrogenase maturation protein HypF